MEYEKMLFYPNPTQMSATSYMPNQTQCFKLSEPEHNQRCYDPFVIFADNFDLSLLPQDTNSTSDTNIPTTVYQYNDNSNNNLNNSQSQSNPTIKIEQSWCKSDIKAEQSYSLLYEQLSRQSNTTNQLIPPPPAYPSIYPSPQSSPSQSEYSFAYTPNSSSGSSTSGYESLSSSRASLYSTSPCPSLDATSIKQELHILPPSPPESNCEAHSPRSICADIKCEPFESDVEGTLIDLNTLLVTSNNSRDSDNCEENCAQRKLNLKALALETFIGGLDAGTEDFEPVISLALQHVKREADAVCEKLQISQDPTAWSVLQVHAWLRCTIQQFKLPLIDNLEVKFNENGASLVLLSEEEFIRRAPESGSILHAQLEIWKLAYSEDYKNNAMASQMYANNTTNSNWSNTTLSNDNGMQMDVDQLGSDDELDDDLAASTASIANNTETNETATTNGTDSTTPKHPGLPIILSAASTTSTTTTSGTATAPPQRNGGAHIHLWQFLKELLQSPHINGTAIRWIDRSKGIFKIEDSVRVAKLWGKRKNRPAMNYDKLSRSIRQYYKKGIMKKTERSQRLVYQFCHPYYL